MKQINTCDLCGGNNLKLLFKNHDRMQGAEGEFDVLRCSDCSLLIHNPQVELHEIDKYYPSDSYYSLSSIGNKKSLLKKLSDYLYSLYFGKNGNILLKILFYPIKPLLRTIVVVEGGKFLDLGSGSGNFLLQVRNFGMEVYGVEPGNYDKESAEKLGLRIYHKDLYSCNFPDNFFDFISLNHVFEHVPDPTKLLTELKRVLKKGGSLVIVVPNEDSFAFKFFKKYWVYLDTPRHLYNYSPKTLDLYAKKVGLKKIKLRYNSSPIQFFGSALYYINDHFRKNKYLKDSKFIDNMIQGYSFWLNLLINLPLMPFAYLLNFMRQGDAIEYTMTKEND